MNSETKSGDELLNQDLIKQADETLKFHQEIDAFLRKKLSEYWKDKEMIMQVSESLHMNSKTIKALENEIKDRNSRIFNK